jgi:hypothetical protein
LLDAFECKFEERGGGVSLWIAPHAHEQLAHDCPQPITARLVRVLAPQHVREDALSVEPLWEVEVTRVVSRPLGFAT